MGAKPPVERHDNLLWSEAEETQRIAQAERWSERDWQTHQDLCGELADLEIDYVVVVRPEQHDLIGLQVSGYRGIQPEQETGALLKLTALRNEVRVTQEFQHVSYIREKLRGAATTIRDDDGRSMQDRLWSAYLYNLSSLQAEWFTHDTQTEFAEIEKKLSKYGEAVEGAGSVPITLWTMSDDEAAGIARRVLALAERYFA
jgi:hypothetical protein